MTVEWSDKNHIDAIINKDMEDEGRFTGFYGELETFRTIESRNLLQSLNQKFQTPWLCAGDFNELIRSDANLGGRGE